MRKVTLSKGSTLWEAGDAAKTIAVLDKGTIGIKTERGLVGVVSGRSVLGEGAILTIRGESQKRSATLFALEDDTQITEYPAEMVKQAVDGGKDQVAPLVLKTLVGQACRNLLIVIAAHRGRTLVENPLKALMQSLIERARELKAVSNWDDFMNSFRFLSMLRDSSEKMRAELLEVSRAEAAVKASEAVKDLFKGQQDVAQYLEELVREEKEKEQWLDRRGGVSQS